MRFYDKLDINHYKISGIIEKLEQIDPLRNRYYADCKSKWVTKSLVKSIIKDNSDVDFTILRSQNLTILPDPVKFCYLKRIDLSGNLLRDCGFVTALISVVELNLESNLLGSLDGIEHLRHLTRLNVSNNKIKSLQGCESLQNVPTLKAIDIHGNMLTLAEIEIVNKWINVC